ncbi:N-acetylmuramoyl-L-alanine amidase [Desulfococcus sp.]|uniref:N-acetylmuramoyl-L-alanine amidase n=1 Tax=Desulfococcus sp. TaxID=2025834 RepID=UPI003D0F2EDC
MKLYCKVVFSLLMISIVAILCLPSPLPAVTEKQEYDRAHSYFEKFIKDSKRKQYRDNWMTCIQKFQAAYRRNPGGNYAAANLFMAGKIYNDLYALSGRLSDRKESVDIFNRLINRHPKSRYRSKAQAVLRSFEDKKTSSGSAAPDAVPTAATESASAERSVYHKERSSRFKQAKTAFKADTSNDVPGDDPISRLIVIEETCDPKAFSSPPKAPASSRGGSPTVINRLRYWSNPSYTRVVIDGNRETTYTPNLLKQDPDSDKPQRLYIDFENSRLGQDLQKAVPIDDDLLLGARAGQCTPDVVRVVVDIKSFKTYKVFSLSNPFRTIIDVWGKDSGETAPAKAVAAGTKQTRLPHKKPLVAPKPHVYHAAIRSQSAITANDLAKQFALGVKRIVIDAGHGGHDGGAPGYIKGVREKDVVLSIARRLAKKIRNELGCEVIMTRNSDRFLTLEERTAIANTQNADLFISIHCNASKSPRAYGFETYYLNLATDDDAILVAARENATSRKTISDLQNILNDLMQNSKINESSRLATYVQNSLYSQMKGNYRYVSNKGVKQAPFYVLLGAQMPAILVETSFISNERECKRLVTAQYQEDLCKAIVKGVRGYIRETTPTAFWNPRPSKKG